MSTVSGALGWGLVGGGEGSQIGDAHRFAARLDGLFSLDAAALDADAERGAAFATRLGLAPERGYGTWTAMLAGEREREDRPRLVTVATPNSTHFEIASAFIEAGFDVLCEKPMTMTVEEAESLAANAAERGRVLAVNFGYSGYAMVREARAMVHDGRLGRIRVVVAEFAHGFHADAADADNPRVRWRYDPAVAGVSSVLADAGIHALHLATYITGQRVESVSATFDSCLPGRELEDDALLGLRLSGGAAGRLWTSGVAVGQMHGLNIRVFGEKGGLAWRQQWPDQLQWTPLGEPTRTLERGAPGLGEDSLRGSRIAVGHADGMIGAFANLYADLHAAIASDAGSGARTDALARLPLADAGVETVRLVHAAARSAREGSAWVTL